MIVGRELCIPQTTATHAGGSLIPWRTDPFSLGPVSSQQPQIRVKLVVEILQPGSAFEDVK